MVPQFSTVHFLPFLAHTRPFLGIFWVLEVGHRGPFWPKYAPGTGWHWEQKKCRYIKNEHVHVTFTNPIFRNFVWNDKVKSFFTLWGWVEWTGAELNGIDTWKCHIWLPEPPAFKNTYYMLGLSNIFQLNFLHVFCNSTKSIANSRG